MKWDPRGQLLATCGVDGVCRIWKDMESVWTCVHTLVPPHEPVSLAWSPLVGKGTCLFFQYVHVILIHIQQDATLHSLLYLEAALHVSGGTSTHHQEHIQLYLQHLVFVTPLLLSAALVEELLNTFQVVPPPVIRSAYNCIYSIWYLSHHYCYLPLSWKRWNSSMIEAGSSNGVTNTRCFRYSCMCS